MIYIHVPFCESRCTYCGFYSNVILSNAKNLCFESYAEAVCKEIAARREEIAQTLGVNTLYIGGGTPSVLPLDILERLVRLVGDAVYGQEPPSGDGSASGGRPVSGRRFEEFTIEVNPEDIVEKAWTTPRDSSGLGSTG